MAHLRRISWESILMSGFVAYMVLAVLLIAIAEPSWGLITSLSLVALALGLVVRWHARTTTYCCPACHRVFRLSPWSDFLHPHGGHHKYVGCPHCGEIGWCEETGRSNLEGQARRAESPPS